MISYTLSFDGISSTLLKRLTEPCCRHAIEYFNYKSCPLYFMWWQCNIQYLSLAEAHHVAHKARQFKFEAFSVKRHKLDATPHCIGMWWSYGQNILAPMPRVTGTKESTIIHVQLSEHRSQLSQLKRPTQCHMETFDVESLYTNVDSDYAIKCLIDFAKGFWLPFCGLKITGFEILPTACQKCNKFPL